MGLIRIVQGDITNFPVDAVVNPTRWTQSEDNNRFNQGIGQAVLAEGYALPAKFVIYTVGPVWQGGNENEDELLATCYRNALKMASENGVKTMAFPSLEAEYYKFPVRRAARIAILEISDFLEENKGIEKVFVVCYDENTIEAYMSAMQEIGYGA